MNIMRSEAEADSPKLQESRRLCPENVVLIDELVDWSLSSFPESVAFIHDGKPLSRADLRLHIQQVAGELHGLGVVANEPVAVFIEHSLELAAGVLGVLAAGGCCVPIDPSLPPARIRDILEDICPRVIVTSGSAAKLPVNSKISILKIDLRQPVPREAGEIQNRLPRSGTDLAFIVYTSGSTGGPKGVEISHQGYSRRAVQAVRNSDVYPSDVDILWTPASFIVMLDELLFPLLFGVPAVIASPRLRLDPLALSALISREKISFLRVTPSLLRMLLLAGDLHRYRSIRAFFCSGELLPENLRQMFFEKMNADLYSFYGCTEAAGVLCWQYEADAKPLTHTLGYLTEVAKIQILQEDLSRAGIGEVGEIYVGGPGVARGYWNKPELTQARFLKRGADRESEEVWFRTGDLGREQAGGIYEVLGRCDATEVNIRGVRINLDEIETCASKLEGVEQAAVTVHQPGNGDSQQLVLHWIASVDMMTTEEKIRQHLQRTFPDHMVPVHFIQHRQFKLTPNGKIDRLSLGALVPGKKELDRNSILPGEGRVNPVSAPKNLVEEKLLAIWRRVLGIKEIGVEDGFFNLGGDSLQAVLMFTEMEKQFSFHHPISMLLEKPTIRQLAESVNQNEQLDSSSVIVPLKLAGNKEPIFMIHAQDGNVLFYRELAHSIDRDRPVYGVQSFFHIDLNYKPDSYEEMAARYMDAIMNVQPHGPYHLCGRCFGGALATEIARQILIKGERVSFLGVIDSAPPKISGENNKSKHMKEAGSGMVKQHPAGKLEKIYLHVKNGRVLLVSSTYARNLYRKYTSNLRSNFYLRDSIVIPTLFRLINGFNRYKQKRTRLLNSKLFRPYYSQHYRGEIILFHSNEFSSHPEKSKREAIWNKVCDGHLTCHILEGGHHSIMNQPGVTQLGELIRKEIDSSSGTGDDTPHQE